MGWIKKLGGKEWMFDNVYKNLTNFILDCN